METPETLTAFFKDRELIEGKFGCTDITNPHKMVSEALKRLEQPLKSKDRQANFERLVWYKQIILENE